MFSELNEVERFTQFLGFAKSGLTSADVAKEWGIKPEAVSNYRSQLKTKVLKGKLRLIDGQGNGINVVDDAVVLIKGGVTTPISDENIDTIIPSLKARPRGITANNKPIENEAAVAALMSVLTE